MTNRRPTASETGSAITLGLVTAMAISIVLGVW